MAGSSLIVDVRLKSSLSTTGTGLFRVDMLLKRLLGTLCTGYLVREVACNLVFLALCSGFLGIHVGNTVCLFGVDIVLQGLLGLLGTLTLIGNGSTATLLDSVDIVLKLLLGFERTTLFCVDVVL